MATFEKTFGNGYKLRLVTTEKSQSVSANTTSLEVKAQLVSTGSSYTINSSASKDIKLTINGKTYSSTCTVGLSGGSTKTLYTQTVSIPHNSDGTKTVSVSCTLDIEVTISGSYISSVTASGSTPLTTIPRKSDLGAISGFTLGNAITLSISKKSSSFTDSLTIKLGSTTVKTVSTVSNGSSISFTSAELNTIYGLLPNATKGTFTFTITTKSGSTTIGTSSRSATGTIPSTVKPAISTCTLAEQVSGIASQFGGFVKTMSKVKGTISASAGTGSSIETYKTVINGTTYTSTSNTFITGLLKTAGSNSYTVTVTDKRGRTASKSFTFTVLDYSSPTISTFKVIRCQADGTEDPTGAYAKYTVNASVNSVGSKNKSTIVVQYKKTTSNTWTNAKSVTAYTLNETGTPIANDTESQYNWRVTATDFFGDSTQAIKTVMLSTAQTILDFLADGTGLAVGKVATDSNTFDVGNPQTYLSQNVYMMGKQRSDAEKNIYFQSTANSEYKHNCKVYGGNGTSETSIGMWDSDHSRLIYRYLAHLNEFAFGADMDITQNGRPVLVETGKQNNNIQGYMRFNNGLLIQWGNVNITPVANTPTKATLTYPIAYSKTPIVMVSASSTVVGTSVTGVGQASTTATNVEIYVTRTNTTATAVRWVAIGYAE